MSSTTRTSTRNAFFNFDFFFCFFFFFFSTSFAALQSTDRPTGTCSIYTLAPSLESSVTLLSWNVFFRVCKTMSDSNCTLSTPSNLSAVCERYPSVVIVGIYRCAHHFATALNFSLLTWIILCAACDSLHCSLYGYAHSSQRTMFQGFRFIHMDEIASESFFFFFFFPFFIIILFLLALPCPLCGCALRRRLSIEYICAYCLVALPSHNSIIYIRHVYADGIWWCLCLSLSYVLVASSGFHVSLFLQTANCTARRCYANTDKCTLHTRHWSNCHHHASMSVWSHSDAVLEIPLWHFKIVIFSDKVLRFRASK